MTPDGMTRADVAKALRLSVDGVLRLEQRALRRLRRLAVLREHAPERVDRAARVRFARSPEVVEPDEPEPSATPEQRAVRALAAIFDPNVSDEAACDAIWKIYEKNSPRPPSAPKPTTDEDIPTRRLDPYAGVDAWGRR